MHLRLRQTTRGDAVNAVFIALLINAAFCICGGIEKVWNRWQR